MTGLVTQRLTLRKTPKQLEILFYKDVFAHEDGRGNADSIIPR